jgi:multidrug efflux pump
MAKFFIDRPVFAWVVSILIMLAGVLAIRESSVAQYPSVAPPSVSVSATYAGASAETVQNTVTTLLEQQMTGIDNLQYMSASSSASGQSQLTLYFKPGTSPDTAQVQVQNKVQLATPSLPQTVQQQGITVAKATRNFMLIVSLYCTNGTMDQYALGNFVAASVLDPLRRVQGVGEASMFGSEYAMRIWLNPDQLNRFGMTPGDVTAAISTQNSDVSVGELGALPAVDGQQLNVTLRAQSSLRTPAQFENILLRVSTNGARVFLRDVARVELGGESYTSLARANGEPGVGVAIKLAPGANALTTATAVQTKMNELAKFFPPGIRIIYPMDSSTFIKISIEGVIETLVIAIVLVFLVMFLFLQNLRATLIPTIVIPVALLGTFASMYAFGFSINVLTLFGVVLAIGILVDDAIVVIENVERLMHDEGLPPREATRKAMEQITGALIGITLVLTAVFIPMAFFSGSVGTIYRQFSLSLVSAMVFSVCLAMSLTPALCASLLRPMEPGHKHEKHGFFGWFNRSFASGSKKYRGWVAQWLKRPVWSFALYGVILVVMGVMYWRLPSSFLPEEDQGFFITSIQLPVGATAERSTKVLEHIEAYYKAQPEVEGFMSVVGFSFNGDGQNGAVAFVRLKNWSQRKGKEHSVQNVAARATREFSSIKDAMVFAMVPAAITELAMQSGFDMELQDLGGLGHDRLMSAQDQLLQLAGRDPRVTAVRVQGKDDEPQLQIEVDQEKTSALGVDLGDLNTTLSTCFGSAYVNNFVNGSRVQRVLVQLDAPFRMKPEDIEKLFVRNHGGTMVPLSAVTTMKWSSGSPNLQRYDGFPSVEIVGSPASGRSSGEAMQAMEELASKLPAGIGYEWTGQSYEERLSGTQAPMLYGISLLVVFLCLAALYESWSIPTAVLLVVPLGVVGALAATLFRGLENDVYFKVGFLTIIGLSTKNAILIVEFAKDAQMRGLGLVEATLEAVQLRLRPILMTSFAFILGVTPLALATGAGSAGQHAIGTGVIGGMLTATTLAIFLVPVFFVVVRRTFKGKNTLVAKSTGAKPGAS